MATPCEVPFNYVDNLLEITPEGVIQLAISTLRHSDSSDAEMAAYTCEMLSLIMQKNNRIIEAKKLGVLIFEKCQKHED